MARTGVRDGFELDDHGILRDSFTSDFHVDEDGILHDDLDLLKHTITTASHGTDSGINGDKPSSSTSTLQHVHTASFDEELAPIGDESINISDFEASRDDLDSTEGDLDGGQGSGQAENRRKVKGEGEGKGQALFSEEYYQQLRELGVLVDGADFSREESQNELDALEAHLSRDHDDYDDTNRDLIGEYLEEQYDQTKADTAKSANSQATSAPSVSAFSDDMDVMYNEVQNVDDDEIFLINRHLLPASSNIQAEKLRGTPSDQGSRPGSMAGRAPSPRSSHKRHGYRSKHSPSPSESGPEMDHQSRSEVNTPHRSRPDSAVSFTSAASESVRPQSGASTPGKSSMSKARSQESFFEHGKPSSRGGEKGPKRMLPKPSAVDAQQSHRVRGKSKSVSNIANRSAPLKPTHMSISEITRFTLDEVGDGSVSAGETTLDRSEGELSNQLKQESSKRQQAAELVQQLQKDYDSLLSKYALAELTIDQMRLGARISLHTDSPTPNSVVSGGTSPSACGHKAQMIQIPKASAQRAVSGSFSALPVDAQTHASTQSQTANGRSRSASTPAVKTLIAVRNSLDAGGQGLAAESESRTSITTAGSAETVKLSIHTETASLDDRLDQFQTLVENRQLTLEEQEKVLENIRTDHEKLRRVYLQAKEDYNVLRRSGAGLPDADFDNDKELEGVLFRFGMKFDEIYAKVDSNLKQQSTRRQPFLSTRLTEDQSDDGMDDVDQGPQQERSLDKQSEEAELEKRAEHLHDEYRALMDRYRRLKQMAPTPELNKETDNLVRKLKSICVEMPDMFRLSPEVQERWEKLHRRDQRRSPLPNHKEDGAGGGGTKHREQNGRSSVSSTSKPRGAPLMGDHSISPFPSHRHDSRDSRMDDSFSRTPSSLSGSRSSLASPRDPNSSTAVNRSSPSLRGAERGSSPSSLDGAAAPRSRDDDYNARINRPRRHHHNFRDPKSGKRAETGSYSSLADSGLSDHEGCDRPRHHDDANDALAQLPGPGKMKQMTHQRRENDVDSGFVGSMVSTEGAQQQQPPPSDRQPEPTLRLRERPPSDRNQDRSRRGSSASSSSMTSTRRESGGEHRSRHSKPPRGATSTSAGAGHRSIDRSYDGELDESTLSHALSTELQGRGARPKEPSGRPKGARKEDVKSGGRTTDTRMSRSHSDSMQDDETLEDMSDGDITDVSTPRLIETPTTEAKTTKTSTQPSQTSELPPPRPPTPQESTPPRPPTPYRVEMKEESAEAGMSTVKTPSAEEKSPPEEEKQQQLQQQEPSKSHTTTVTQPTQSQLERPDSRGEPTTDLYHTRSKRERKRDRAYDAESVTSMESARAGSRRGRRGSDSSLRVRGEDRGVGSDVEVGSDLTRVSSVHSARLRAMQDEIEKLKQGVQMAHNKASERPEPPPLPPPQQQQQQQPEGPEYYDPFDDPYGFMRMPRRRANSFSGGRVREFDEWYWTLPNDRRNGDDDIPLGYAAADAYNRHYREKTPEAARQRLRHRGDRRRRHGNEAPPNLTAPGAVVVNGGEERGVAGMTGTSLHAGTTTTNATTAATANPPATNTLLPGAAAQMRRPSARDPRSQYSYYIPGRRSHQAETTASAGPPYNPNLNPYRRQHTTPLSASQPNLSQTLAGVEPPSLHPHLTRQHQQQHQQQQQQQQQPWYTIRRSPWAASSASPLQGGYSHTPEYQPSYFYQPESSSAGYYSTYPSSESSAGVQGGTGYWTDACPMCGGSGTHTHDGDGQVLSGYRAEGYVYGYPSDGRSRKRSRSVPRSRHYKPEGWRSRHSYRVREVIETDSEDSDDWERDREHRRSRSWSRHRSLSPSRRSVSRQRNRHRHRKREQLSGQADTDLSESLMLSEDISRLTKRMLGGVRADLNRHS